MSAINGRQNVGHGVGGGYASVDNAPVATGGVAGFVDDDRLFFNCGDLGWVAATYNLTTRAIDRAVADPGDPRYGRGFNAGGAGGGLWAGWLSGFGLYTSEGLVLPTAGLLAVGPDGAIGYVPDYQVGTPAVCRERDGREWTITAGLCEYLQLLGDGRALWREGDQLRVAGIPQPLQIGTPYWARAHEIGDRWWISYWSDVVGLVLHPFDELVGVVIVPPGVDVWHSARAFGSTILFALFSSEAEAPGQLRREYVDTATVPRVPLEGDGGGEEGGGDGDGDHGGGDGGDTGDGNGDEGGNGGEEGGGDVDPPKGSTMIFIDIRKPNMAAEKCEEIDNGNGTYSYRKVSNGKIFCVTDTGAIEERPEDAAGGAFESFTKTPGALVADRPFNGKQLAYLLPYAEVGS